MPPKFVASRLVALMWYPVSAHAESDTDSGAGDEVTPMFAFNAFGSAWYVTSGDRVGKLTPYAKYARLKADSNSPAPSLDVAALPAFLAGAAMGLNAGPNAILASYAAQSTVSGGARWDFRNDIDLTVQFDHTRNAPGFPATLINLQPGFRPDGAVNLFSATVDFVW
jgi:hypothetical protein